MPTLADRIDLSSISTTFLTLPKGKKRGGGVGFCAGEPVASIEGAGYAAPPFRWTDGKPRAIPFADIKKINANGASDTQIAGFWSTPKSDERGIVWTRSGDELVGVELHPPTWQKSVAIACGDGQQIGYGYENFMKNPSRALLWSGSRDSVVELTGPDPTREAMGHCVAEGIQVGYVGGSGRQRACLWRGTTASFVDLHPAAPGVTGSEAWGTGDGQQVGLLWTEEGASRAALWSGSAESWVDLSPGGFERSRASRCARGFQIGWVCRQGRGMLLRAVLWNSAADDYIDLQDFLEPPWNASWAIDLHVDGDRLRILGTAQQAVTQGRYEVDAGKVPVIWEMTLKVPTPSRRTGAPTTIVTPQAPAEASAPQKVERVADEFAQAVVDGDFAAAHERLAPWLQRQISAEDLQRVLERELIDGVPPTDFSTSGNDSTLSDLREHYSEYHHDERSRTFATTTDFGAYGPPSIHIDEAITAENFRQWMSIEFVPDPDGDSGLDYCLRLWLIVVEVDGVMTIGHLEPGE